MTSTSQENKKAKAFCLPNQNKEKICLKDLLGKYDFVVVYFYPKDNTLGCTTEAVNFTKDLRKYSARKTKIVGISKLSAESKQKFAQKHNLKIDLLTDEDMKIAQKYGAVKEKSNSKGEKVLSVARQTFLIDGKTGKILKHWIKVSPKTHSQEVLEEIDKIRKSRK